MSGKTFKILISVLAVVISILAWANIEQDNRKDWDVCYPMANQNVEWTGAGYSGIYGR